jgi:hypothetical protein
MSEQPKLTPEQCRDAMHEVVDRVSVLANTFESFVYYHPSVVANPGLTADAAKIAESLNELYQEASRLMLAYEPDAS